MQAPSKIIVAQMPTNQHHLALLRPLFCRVNMWFVENLKYLPHALDHLFATTFENKPALQSMNLECKCMLSVVIGQLVFP